MLWIYRLLTMVFVPLVIPIIAVRDRVRDKRRPPWSERFARALPAVEPGGVWIHAVSVGEVEVARRLIAELDRAGFSGPVTVTATTATGLDLARKNLSKRAAIVPTPLDLVGPVARVFEAVKPSVLVLVETELWPEMLYRAGHNGVPIVIVNARLSERSFGRYRRIGPVFAPLLAPLSLVLTRDEGDAERFRRLGLENVRVAGNVKYDLERDGRPLEWDGAVERWADGRPVVVAGSTLEGEEGPVLDAVGAVRGADGRHPLLVLAPRHPERFDAVARLVEDRNLNLVRRSRPAETGDGPVDVVLLDTIGELARAFRHADVAFIGGSLVPRGGHNPLEPAVWGVPVLSGPSVENFEEIYREMTAAGAVRLVGGADALGEALSAWLDDAEEREAAGTAGRRVVEANRGATEKIAAAILSLSDGDTR